MKYRFLTKYHESDKGDNAQGGNGNSTPDSDPAEAPERAAETEKAFTQADVDRIVAERLERAKKSADTIAQKAKDDAEKKALEEQGKFKELAEQAQAKVLDLESKAERVSALEAVVALQVAELRKGLPEPILELLEGRSVESQLEYLVKNRDKLIKPAASPEINGGGGNRTDRTNISTAEIERLRKSGRYGSI